MSGGQMSNIHDRRHLLSDDGRHPPTLTGVHRNVISLSSSELCDCADIETMSHVSESCPISTNRTTVGGIQFTV